MKKLLILSGKGGTGKTTTAAAFISFLNAKAFADCDVDAPNLHLITGIDAEFECSDYLGSQKAVIDSNLCIACGRCKEYCRFNAISNVNNRYEVNLFACEGCGVCQYVCPANAVEMQDDVAGELMLYHKNKTFSTAKLRMGRGTSGKLVTEVKSALTKYAHDAEYAIIDGSPGIGCPVIASISGVDAVLIVAEPSLSGISDMKRILKTAAIFGTKAVVCVNKFDTCVENAKAIERYCQEEGIPFMGVIPYDKSVSAAINEGKSIAEVNCPAKDAFQKIFINVMKQLEEESAT